MSDTKRNYDAGIWGGGSLDKQGLAQYGVDVNAAENRGENALWGRNSSGQEVFLGNFDMAQAGNKDLIAAHAKQANSNEIDHNSQGSDLSSTGDMKGALLTLWNGGDAEKKTLDDYTDRPKDEDHLAAEDAYQENFKNGNPWAATSAVDSYQTAFDRATAAGKSMTANDYLMQRADDKKGGVNRFIGYLGDKNRLANEEQNYASENFMDKAKHLDFQGPPELDDPYDTYSKYKSDIDSIA